MAVFYYYCKLSTFKSMLHSKTLWLTDLTKSNDAEEVFRAYCNLWNRVKLLLEQSDLPKDILKSQELTNYIFFRFPVHNSKNLRK